MEAQVSRQFEKMRQELLSALNQKSNQPKPERPLSTILNKMLKEARHVRLAQEILLSLRYDGMGSRKHTIAETHGDTYEWIFSSPQKIRRQKGLKANFSDWLETDGGIFWVTGHPGSGKSTLMKFVDSHKTTLSKLQTWASGYKLVKASHYFWVNGSALQKSQLGLLRALCFEILRQCPDLVPQFCADRWNDAVSKQDQQPVWHVGELERILHRLQASEFKVTNEKVRFCFFIDGLDEYSGDYEGLLNNLRHLVNSPHIKICAASRPWTLFEEALGQDETRMLTMQELTADDIATYVRDVLEEDEQFTALEKQDSRAHDLIEDIIKRANGVFLWVYLVVRQLQRSLKNGDTFEVLESNVGQFPSDLDDYFRHMLDTVDTFKQRETAQIFRVCIRARQPLALLAFSVLDPDNTITKKLEGDDSVDKKEVDEIHAKMEKQILLRGPELLDVIRDGKYIHVTFTHRSVRDFLTHNNMDTLFAERAGKDFGTGEDFEPLSTLVHMSILTFKRLNLITEPSTVKDHYYTLIDDCLDYAQDMEIAEEKAPYAELNRLEELLEREKGIAEALDTNKTSPLMPLAVRRNLRLYLKQRAERGPGTLQPVLKYPDRPLLSFALPVFRLRADKPAEFRAKMVRLLLSNGSDPNTESWMKDEEANVERKGSVWFLYLRSLYSMQKRSKTRPEGSQPLITTEAIIEAGAQYVPSCLTEDGNKGEKEILEYVFGKNEAARLVGLRAQTAQPVKAARTGSGTTARPSWAKAKAGLRRLSTSRSDAVAS